MNRLDDSIEIVFPPENREVWNYFQRSLKPTTVSNQQRCTLAAKLEKEYKPQYLYLLTKITWFLKCTDN